MATTKQVSFLTALLTERAHDYGNAAVANVEKLSNREASEIIDLLLKAPRRADVVAPATEAAPAFVRASEPGMYKHGEDIVKIQAAKTTGNLYAKKLTQIGGSRLTEQDDRVKFDFAYAPGLVREVRADERLSLDEAKAFGIKYGVCCVCGAFLCDAKSVSEGIGPVCKTRL
jgi:hypothetical protein